MHCRYCNAELMAGAVFCEECGRPVAAGTTEVSPAEDNSTFVQPAPFTPAVLANGPSVRPSDPGQPAFAGPQQPTTSPSEQFGSGPQMAVYAAQQPSPNAGQSPPQEGYASPSYYQGTMPASQINVQPPYATAPQPPTRWKLWVILGTIGALVLIACFVLIGVLVSMNGSTPTGTLNAFCSALKSGDYQAAYNQFSSGLQSQIAEAQLAAGASNLGLGKVKNCTVSNVNDAAGSGTISYTFASGNTLVDDYTLVNQSGVWKINSQQPRSTPTGTLNAFCSALKSGDYQAAYNQFSSGLQSQIAEAQFATVYPSISNLGLGRITNCTVSNVNDTAGSGTFSITFASGNTLVDDATLVNQSGVWKINSYRTRSSPALTLISFCSALLSQNYPAAYNQLSSSQHRLQSEAQFANLFIRDTVSTCMVSNVDDTAGTGSITRTYADGRSNTFGYTLVVENGAWKINTRQLRP